MTHRCVPPFMARTAGCDCCRCCAGAPHEANCMSLDEPECTCPATVDYHLDACPEWQAEVARQTNYKEPVLARQTTAQLVHTTLSASYRRARELARLVEDGDLDLNPPYQRGAVWTDDQRIALIRSWLTGIPSGTVILSDRVNTWWAKTNRGTPLDTGDPTWACVDGKQRISTAAAWFDGDIAVPASWFEPEFVAKTEDTEDGPYVRYGGLTEVGQRVFDSRALIQVAEAKTCASIADEAAIYLLVNGGGTPQTDADMANAARHTNP